MEFSLDLLSETFGKITDFIKHWRFGPKRQLAFLEDLYLLINDGIPANRAIDMMAQVTEGLNQEVATSLSQKISEGQPLADGMRDWFDINIVEIIRVGESGGALAQTIKSAINALMQKGVAISSFIGALSYPLIVIIMSCIIIVYLNTSVFTQFLLIKPLEQWPAAGQRLVSLAWVIQSWWWIVLIVLFSIFLIFRYFLLNLAGNIRDQLDNVPPFNLYRTLVAARFLETLGLLVSNGIVFKSAIKVMQYQANPYLLYHLVKMEHLLGMGKTNIADVLETGLIDRSELMRLRVMAEVKGFEHGLIRMGIRGTEQATATLKLIARMVGGGFLLVGAVLIVMIVQGIYLTGMSLGT